MIPLVLFLITGYWMASLTGEFYEPEVLEFVRNEKHILNIIHGESTTECIMLCKNYRGNACVAVGYKVKGPTLLWNAQQDACYLFKMLDFRIAVEETVKMVSCVFITARKFV